MTTSGRVRLMRTTLTALLLLATAEGAAPGPLEDGAAAYDRRDYPTAYRLWRGLAEQGNAYAAHNLAMMYYHGEGLPQNYAEALKWFRVAADQGAARAQTSLGIMYRDGEGVPQNYAEAVRWFRVAANQGDGAAQNNLGNMYADGHGVRQDYIEAVKWLRLAADQNRAPAQYNLGRMYRNGTGVPRNYAEALRWYSLAADQGYAPAQNSLGLMYHNGEGVPQNDAEAVKWFRLAANQGVAQAQTNLGDMYSHGLGVQRNYSEAMRWYSLAADQGYAPAQRLLREHAASTGQNQNPSSQGEVPLEEESAPVQAKFIGVAIYDPEVMLPICKNEIAQGRAGVCTGYVIAISQGMMAYSAWVPNDSLCFPSDAEYEDMVQVVVSWTELSLRRDPQAARDFMVLTEAALRNTWGCKK